jgi:hypothetical protein
MPPLTATPSSPFLLSAGYVPPAPAPTPAPADPKPAEKPKDCPSGDMFCPDSIPPMNGDAQALGLQPFKWPHAIPGAYAEHGWSLNLEPMQFIAGAPSVNVTSLTKRDGKIILAGNGYYRGVSAFPPVSFDYSHLQIAKRKIYHTDANGVAQETGDYTFSPEALISIGIKGQLINMTNHQYTLEMDEDQFYNDLTTAAQQAGNVDFNTPQLSDNPSPDEIQQFMEDYGNYLNGLISDYSILFEFLTPLLDYLNLLDAQDYVQLKQSDHKELFLKIDMPVSISFGSWLHDNGGQFFDGKVGVGRSIRIGAHLGPTMMYGKSLGGVNWYGNAGAFVDASMLTFYFPKQPTQRSVDVHLRVGLDAYLNFDGSPNDFGSADLGLIVEKRFGHKSQ